MTSNKNFTLISLGCPKNTVDSEIIAASLNQAGWSYISDPKKAHLIIVNTCAFIKEAKEESINTILSLALYKGKLAVCGCLPQRYKNKLLAVLPEVDIWLGCNEVKNVSAFIRKQTHSWSDDTSWWEKTYERLPLEQLPYAYLKISEGCSHRCSFCAIPLIKGSYRSRPMEILIQEAKTLVSRGTKEINLIAQDTTAYGKDLYGKAMLPELLKQLTKIKGLKWLRILYTYPESLTDELISLMKTQPKICSYLDMPLQHASASILKAMNRKGSASQYLALIKKLRSALPGIVIRSSFITGFPGETEDDFETLVKFLKTARLERVGVFKYSREEDTGAYKLKPQIKAQIKQNRFAALMKLQQGIINDYHKTLTDKNMEVMLEAPVEANAPWDGTAWSARSYRDAPEIDTAVWVKTAKSHKSGEFINVTIKQTSAYDLLGEEIK
jgi:ribosomal protein S12 methylthiotransferase